MVHQALVPARYLSLMAHLVLTIMLYFSRVRLDVTWCGTIDVDLKPLLSCRRSHTYWPAYRPVRIKIRKNTAGKTCSYAIRSPHSHCHVTTSYSTLLHNSVICVCIHLFVFVCVCVTRFLAALSFSLFCTVLELGGFFLGLSMFTSLPALFCIP